MNLLGASHQLARTQQSSDLQEPTAADQPNGVESWNLAMLASRSTWLWKLFTVTGMKKQR